jgi:hypothetical protein
MERIIIALTLIVGSISAIFSIKTLIDTRRKHYDKFINNRKERNNELKKN